MIGAILNSIMGDHAAKEGEQDKGIGSLLVIGIILFLLLGGLKLFQKPEDCSEESC